jgi:hypothetical protein
MAVTNGWGQGAKDNTIDWGQGATDNTISWGKSQTVSASGDTNITGASSFVNTKSILLDGVDDYVNCGTNSSLNFERTEAFSYSLWVKRNSFGTNHIVLSKMNPTGNRRGMFFNLNTSNTIVIVLRTDTSNTSQRLLWKSTATITDSNWHNLVFTYDGSSTINGGKIYIDKVVSTLDGASGGALSATIENTAPFLIGAMSTAPLNPADTIIDEVAVFNSELSASNVNAIYGTGAPNDLTDLSPLSWWRCGDGDTSPTLTDNGSASNNGTMTNFTTFSTDVPT